MPRQRFIWPSIWVDPDFGKLRPDEALLFIGLFSNADDDGRLSGDPAYLKGVIFPHKRWSHERVEKLRDTVAETMGSVVLYEVRGEKFIELARWCEYQKPKYPQPSKIPANEGVIPGTFPERSPMGSNRVGLGSSLLQFVGKGRSSPEHDYAIEKLLTALKDKDEGTEGVVRSLVAKHRLAVGDIEFARECAEGPGVISPTKVAVDALKRRRKRSA